MPRRHFEPHIQHIQRTLLKLSNKAVVNLSNYKLKRDEKIVLCRGLSFCPQPASAEIDNLHRDTLLFNRRLRLKHHFKDSTQTVTDPFKQSRGWTPPAG